MMTRLFALLAVFLSFANAADYLVYVGGYTRGAGKGIYAWRFDASKGELASLGLVAETTNPSWITVDPNRRFLYAVGENAKDGSVTAFSIDRHTAKLTPLNTVSSRGSGPCHLSVDKTGRHVLAANYGSGSVAVFPIKADGGLAEASAFLQHTGSSVNPKRQQGPHAHSINLSPDNRFALVPDLGLDKIMIYRFDSTKGSLTGNWPPFAQVAPGAGPRHFAFHPRGRFGYAISEMASTVTVFAYDAKTGALKELQTVSTLPQDFKGQSTAAEIAVDFHGKFLYASNRGGDSIAIFAIDLRKGTLTPSGYAKTSKTPRNFAIDPTGRWLFAANQDSDNIILYRIDPKSGQLTPKGSPIQAYAPVCVTFVKIK
jgi:6-phosphogluconolactonase